MWLVGDSGKLSIPRSLCLSSRATAVATPRPAVDHSSLSCFFYVFPNTAAPPVAATLSVCFLPAQKGPSEAPYGPDAAAANIYQSRRFGLQLRYRPKLRHFHLRDALLHDHLSPHIPPVAWPEDVYKRQPPLLDTVFLQWLDISEMLLKTSRRRRR